MAFMSLNGIDVSYDKKKQILKGLNLEVEEGELVSLLGPSGCGNPQRCAWLPDLSTRRAAPSHWTVRT